MKLPSRLQDYIDQDLQRKRLVRAASSDACITIEGQTLINFSGNDYLGLSQHPKIKQAMIAGIEEFGFGSGASSYVTGYTEAHQTCEQAYAEFLGYPRGLLFGSGYLANIGVLSALATAHHVVLHDQFNHASLIDGVRLAGLDALRYRHCQAQHCQERLKHLTKTPIIMSDGVFSMTGSIAPVAELRKLSDLMIIDDAHGFGVLGDSGRGVSELTNTQPDVLILPMGKAPGGYGAMVLGSDEIIETILQFSRSAIYSTALPPAVAIGLTESLSVLQQESWRRERLHHIIDSVQARLSQWLAYPSKTPIFCLPLQTNARALAFEQHCRDRGILARAMRYPTVPKGKPQLRLTVSALHTDEQLEHLFLTLEHAYATL